MAQNSVSEVVSALLKLEQHMEPAGPKAVIAALVPLVTLYGVQDRSEAEWATFWGLYAKVLADLPAEAIRKGVEEYISLPSSEFFPKPGPLHAICERHAVPIRMALGRLRKAVAIQDQRPPPPADPKAREFVAGFMGSRL